MTLLIKPASANCNMQCSYCFYDDLSHNRAVASHGIMQRSTMEVIIRKALAASSGQCTFAFQGGEPTLAGLDYYQVFTGLVKQHNRKGLPILYTMQTNGYALDRTWVEFLHRHRFLVGLSLDGTKTCHDLYRLDRDGRGTYGKVMHALQLLQNSNIEYNILCTVTAQTAHRIAGIYGFFRRNKIRHMQFIRCLDPIREKRGRRAYSLTPGQYGDFLCTLFDLWYNDRLHGVPVSIRQFDNLLYMLQGGEPESCDMLGQCSRQVVVEADGSVYPCDFYVLDRYCLGNLNHCDILDIEAKRDLSRFIEPSLAISQACGDCEWYSLCRGGCRRDREPLVDGRLSRNYYCPSFRQFFPYAYTRLSRIAGIS